MSDTSSTVNAPLTPDEMAVIDQEVGWPASDIAEAVAIEIDQSGGHSDEIGWDDNGQTVADTTGTTVPTVPWSSYDTGNFQINSSSDPSGQPSVADPAWMTEMEDPVSNAEQALEMFESRGFEPWENSSGQLYAPADLAAGEQAAGDLAAATPAQLTSAWSFIKNTLHDIKGDVDSPTGAIGTGVAAVAGTVTSGWESWALKAGVGLAGATLIILGIYAAAKSPTPRPDSSHPVVDAATMAAMA